MASEELELEMNDFNRRQLVRFLSSHHGSALTYYPQRHIIGVLRGDSYGRHLKMFQDVAKSIVAMKNEIGAELSVTDDPSDVCYFFFSKAYELVSPAEDVSDDERILKVLLSASVAEVTGDLVAVSEAHPALSSLKCYFAQLGEVRQFECVQETVKLFKYNRILSKVRMSIQQGHIQGDERRRSIINSTEVRVDHQKEMIMVYLKNRSPLIYLMSYEHMLMILDVLSCRLMTKMTVLINDRTGKDNLPSWNVIESIYRWGDRLVFDFKMPSYSIIGEYETMVTAAFVGFRDTDPLGLSEQFIKSIVETCNEAENEHGIPTQRSLALLTILNGIESVNWLSEVFGLRKHWGNPMVDAAASGKSVQEKVDEYLPVEGPALVKLQASFNRMITIEFIRQHGEWPKCVFNPQGEMTPLGKAHAVNCTRLPETHHDHLHIHWSWMQFLPNCIIDTYFNDISLISDKSVSLYRSHLDASYVRNLCNVAVPRDFPENRRLILEYIRKQHLSVMDIFKIIMSNAIPTEWLANCAAMKGTEMKYLKARIFAVLTYEIRQYFTATEDIIKENLFRYNPHQTMTLSESELLARLRGMTRQLDSTSESRWLSVMHIIDFSKWNLRMRYENTSRVFKSMDDFLGTPGLIEQSHKIFANMLNMVQDAFNPPPDGVLFTEDDRIWINHLCGWEGQRQKGWTLQTSAVLSDLERETGVQSVICGQGDNQTLLTKFPIPSTYRNAQDWIKRDPDGVRSTLDAFYEKLEAECVAIGLKIKTAESCRSLTYYNYGKRLFFSGSELSMVLKRISKNITEPNDSYPTSEALFKTIEGAAFASGLFSHPSVLPYWAARFSVALQIYESYNQNQLVGRAGMNHVRSNSLAFNQKFVRILMKVPSIIGGPPQQHLPAFLFRGHPDPAAAEFVMMVLRARAGCRVSVRILTLLRSGLWFNKGQIDRTSLIHAPYSLNLVVPLSARIPLEREILPAVRNSCGNHLIYDMFSTDTDNLEKEILEILSTMTPFQPVVVNDIFSRTVPGRRKAFLSGLANTTSMGRLVYENKLSPIVLKVQELELRQLDFWTTQVRAVLDATPDENVVNIPHHRLLQEAREVSWGVAIKGVTVPHPLEQFVLSISPHDMCLGSCGVSEEEHLVFVRHSESLIEIPGGDRESLVCQRSRSGKPYLGSQVSEGIIQKQIVCTNPDDTWRDIIRLNTVRRWVCHGDSCLSDLLKWLIENRTDVDQSIIDAATGHPSRSAYNHRAALMATVQESNVSSTTNMHTRIYLSSNRMGLYSHGGENYHMSFGSAFLCFQELICLLGVCDPTSWNSTLREVYHAHVRNSDVPPVYEGLVEVSNIGDLFMRARYKVPPLLHCSQDKLEFQIPTGVRINSIWEPYELAGTRVSRLAYANQLIGNLFVSETNAHELITLDRFVDFSYRAAPISIGDVKLSGVRTLIRAISWQMILLSPCSVWNNDNSQGFTVRAMQFIAGFSTSFWSHFSSAYSNSRLSSELLRHYPGTETPFITKTVNGIVDTIKMAVVSEMWYIHQGFMEASRHESRSAPMDIFASSLSSAKLLWSKFIEYIVFTTCLRAGLTLPASISYMRDFAANILSSDSELVVDIINRIHLDFAELCNYCSIRGFWLPRMRFYSLQCPWVDRLRDPTMEENVDDALEENLITVPNVYPACDHMLQITLDPESLYQELGACGCLPLDRSNSLHSECYFSLTGTMSKSHLKFLDIIYSFKLPIDVVICLGSSTGTEAHSIACHEECSAVYVNCYSPLTSMSPHMGGSYVPAAFVGSGNKHKLINPSQAVLSDSDLTKDSCVGAICSHLSEANPIGMTCDAEIPEDETHNTVHLICSNILKVVRRLITIRWVVVKVPVGCKHNVQALVGKFGKAFRSVDLVSSPFSRPGMPIAYLVCTNKNAVIRDPPSTDRSAPASLIRDERIDDFIKELVVPNICRLFSTPLRTLSSRTIALGTALPSFKVACNRYIPGWQVVCHRIPTRVDLLRQIPLLVSKIEDSYQDTIAIFFRAHNSVAMPRNVILQTDFSPLHDQLNKAFYMIKRLHLLNDLIRPEMFNVEDSVKIIDCWLSQRHTHFMRNRSFSIEVEASSFINYYSRYLFEILGHVYGKDFCRIDRLRLKQSFHFLKSVPCTDFEGNLWDIQFRTNQRQPVDLRWRWQRRAEILSWMLAAHLLGRAVIYSPHLFHLDDFHQKGKLMNCIKWDESSDSPNTFWISDQEDYQFMKETTIDPFVVVADSSWAPLLNIDYTLSEVYKCPWSGLLPSWVLMKCEKKTTQFIVDGIYLDTTTLSRTKFINWEYSSTCPCWDCVLESILCKMFQINSSWLDRQCSLGKVESVRDLAHSL